MCGFLYKKSPLKNDNVNSYEGSLLIFEKKYLHTEKTEEIQKNRICWVAIRRFKYYYPTYVNVSFYKHFPTLNIMARFQKDKVSLGEDF